MDPTVPCGRDCPWDSALPSLKMTLLASADCFLTYFIAELQGCFGVALLSEVSLTLNQR